MSTNTELPPEIWEQVMNRLEVGSDIKSCSLVCRLRYPFTSEVLFKEKKVILRYADLNNFFSMCSNPNADFCRKVKKMEYKYMTMGGRMAVNLHSFIMVLNICKGLEYIIIDSWSNTIPLLHALNNPGDFLDVDSVNFLPHLQRLVVFDVGKKVWSTR